MPGAKDLNPSGSLEEYIGNAVREARIRKGRETREPKEWTQAALGVKVFSSSTRISEIELGEDPPDRGLAARLEQVLGLERDSLVDLVKLLSQQHIRGYAQNFLRKQPTAKVIHQFANVVPGLLQTAKYASSVIDLGMNYPRHVLADHVARRQERQKIWKDPHCPWMVSLIAEAALRQATGGRAAMREQIEHLITMSEHPSISILIVPGHVPIPASSFTLLTLPNGGQGAYREGFETGSYTEEQDEVVRFQRVYDLLLSEALPGHASCELMRSLAKEHDV